MAGNYLKSLQLAKQLEERAKEATKNRELAEKEHESLQQFLKQCKENDVELSEVQKLLGDFNASMASKDYQTAFAHVKKASEAAKNAYIRRIGDVADSVDALLNMAQVPPAESKGALEMLEKSKQLVVRDDLEGAMKQAKSAYDAAERAVHEHFSEMLSQAQEIIIQAKEMGDDVTIYEDLLSRAKSALDNQEYEDSFSQIKEALDGAGENVKTQISTAISRAEEIMVAGEELGADIGRIKSHIEKAKNSINSLKFKESLAYAKRAESEGENIIASKFQDLTRDAREGIKKVRAAGQDASVSQNLLDEAQNAMKDKRYIEALRALTLAKDKVQETEFQSVLNVISKARDRFVLAKKVDVDMTKAILLLNTSRDNLKLGKFEDALSYAEQSQKEIDSALEVFYKARDQLVELAKAIKFAGDLGADVSATKVTLTEAKKSFENREYAKTAELAGEGLGLSKKVAYDKTTERLDRAAKAVKLGKKMAADITEADGVLQRALASMAKEDLLETAELAKSSLGAANAAMSRIMSDRLQNMDQFVKGYSGEVDLAEVRQLLERARVQVAAMELEDAHNIITEVTQRIEQSGQEECDRLLAIADERIDALKAMGGDVSDLEILIGRSREALSQKVFDAASARAREVIQNAEELMASLVQAEFSAVKDTIEEAKAIGLDIEEAKTRLMEARAKADSKEMPEAHRMILETKISLQEKISRHDGIKEKIRKAEELLAEAGKTKADVGSMTQKLDGAKNAFSSGDFVDSERMIDNLLVETEKNLAMYLSAKFILAVKESVDLAQIYGIGTDSSQELLARAKDLMKKKKYDEALALAKQSDAEIRRTLMSSVSDMIKELQRLLTDAKNVGVDTLGPEKLTEKALDLSKNGDYAEALKCISAARDDIDHVKSLSSQAAIEIRVARNNLKDAETLDMDVGRGREFLEQAVEALTRHQYAIALELARKSSEASSEVTKSRIWDTLNKFKDRIEKASSEGAPIGMAERCVGEGVQAFKDGKYQDALKLAMKCEAEMERAELQRDISMRAVEMARRKLEEATAEGMKNPMLTSLVNKASRLLEEGKYVDAMTAAIESGDELHLMRENVDSARIELSSVREQVERLKKVKIETSECDEILDMAQDYLASHDFDKCRDALRRCSAKAATLFESSIRETMDRNQQLIAKARSIGVNTKACEDLLEVAKTSFSEKLWDFAFQQAQACTQTCMELIGKKMSNLIGEVRERAQVMSRLGASVKPVEDMLEEATQTNESGNSNAAFQIVMNAEQKLMAIENTHKKYVDISIAAESAIESLKRFGISTKESERLLALADIEKEHDYDSAIEFVAEALDTAKSLMESYSPDISGSVSTVGLQDSVEGIVTIDLKNRGRALAKEVSLELKGDFEADKVPEIAELRAGSEESIKVKITPKRPGSLPVRVKVRSKRHFDGRPQTFDFEDAVTVYPAGPPFTQGRASDMTKCVSCQGRIKPGFDIVICRCGNELHLTCAKRVTACPICGQRYSF